MMKGNERACRPRRAMPRGALPFLLALLAWLCLQVAGSDFWTRGAPFRGFPSGHGGERDYYELLGVRPGCSQSDIKTAFRKRAMSTHPDKGGDTEAFKKLVEAYEVLSDPSLRSLYDLGGEPARSHPFSSHPGFSSFFRSYSMPSVYRLEVTLEDLFHGRNFLLTLSGQQLNVHIAAGMAHGSHVRVKLDGHRELILVLRQLPHAVFRRKGADLYMKATISLAEALLGFELPVTLPSGESVVLHYGEVVSPNEVLAFDGIGMPVFSSPDNALRGRLFVTVNVRFPERLSLTGPSAERETETLRRLLSGSPLKSREESQPRKSRPSSPSSVDSDGRGAARRVAGSKSDRRAFGARNDKFGDDDEEGEDEDFDDEEGGSSFFRSFLFR